MLDLLHRQSSQKGFILVTAYLMLTCASILSYALFNRGTGFINAVERTQNKLIAFNSAEAGIDMALTQLSTDPTYTGSSYTALNSAHSLGGYSVTVTTPDDNANVRIVSATGYAPDNSSSSKNKETRSVTAYLEYSSQNYFDYAVFAEDSINMSGNANVDSYNSTLGAYGGSNMGSNGDVGTDSTDESTFDIGGNTTINGDVVVGPGGDPSSVISLSGHGTYTGEPDAAPSERDYQTPAAPVASSGALSIAGNTNYTLAAGTYHFDSIQITGNARITVTGPVTVYVAGAITIAGNGITNSSQEPPDCVFFVTGNEDVKFAGNGNFFGAMFAPNSHVKNTGNGEVYGAIVADTYTQTGNGNVHFDEALMDLGGDGDEELRVLAWQEDSTSAWR